MNLLKIQPVCSGRRRKRRENRNPAIDERDKDFIESHRAEIIEEINRRKEAARIEKRFFIN